jgi:hypothetical protein
MWRTDNDGYNITAQIIIIIIIIIIIMELMITIAMMVTQNLVRAILKEMLLVIFILISMTTIMMMMNITIIIIIIKSGRYPSNKMPVICMIRTFSDPRVQTTMTSGSRAAMWLRHPPPPLAGVPTKSIERRSSRKEATIHHESL